MKNFEKILSLLVCLALMLDAAMLLTACDGGGEGSGEEENEPCTKHIDADGNYLCDNCEAVVIPPCNHIDADYNGYCDECTEPYTVSVTFTVTIKDESGAGLPNITLSLYQNSVEKASFLTDNEGKITGTISAGAYQINAEGLPEYWTSNASFASLTINESNTEFTYTAIDNTPDGTEDNPFPAENAETGEGATVLIPAGASYIFTCKGSTRYLIIENASVKVLYNDVEYTPEAGVIRIMMTATADTNTSAFFTVENTSSADTTVKIVFEGIPGTSDNPYEAELGKTETVRLEAESTVYYSLTASATGILMLKSETPVNHIMLYNTTSYVVTDYTNGDMTTYIYVTAGDVVSITVALVEGAVASDVTFTLTQHTGTESDPIPVYESAYLRLMADSSYYIVYHGEENTLSIPKSDTEVSLNGTAQTAGNKSYTFTVTEGDVIVISNTSSNRNDIQITVS